MHIVPNNRCATTGMHLRIAAIFPTALPHWALRCFTAFSLLFSISTVRAQEAAPAAGLPAESAVRSRQPTTWDVYTLRIIAVGAVCIAEATLIGFLLMNLACRRTAERSLRESEGRFRSVADAAPC